jgi:polyferredoxin
MQSMANPKRFTRIRHLVQTAVLAVWLSPFLSVPRLCLPVLHCHSCVLSAFACPIGVLANFSAWHVFPVAAVGIILAVAAGLGSLACGWVCPFGLLQDLLAKLPTPKLRIPSWMGVGRYVVLAGLVAAGPFWLGEGSALFFCRLCPAGTLEAAIPGEIKSGNWPSAARLVAFGLVLAAILLNHRPWCRVLCPLGGMLALTNQWSLFRLRWDKGRCTQCGKCRRDCPYGVALPEALNSSHCLRCLQCTTEACGALRTNSSKAPLPEGKVSET